MHFFPRFIEFIKNIYPTQDKIHLHTASFIRKDREALKNCLDSGVISTYSAITSEFENKLIHITGIPNAVAMVNATSCLNLAMKCLGIGEGDEVIVPAVSFISAANSVSYLGAQPVFLDVDKESIALVPEKLEEWLLQNSTYKNGMLFNKKSRRIIKAIMAVHSLGFIGRIKELQTLCNKYGLLLIEDGAQALGSLRDTIHSGFWGEFAVISFNGNKVVTTGGGGAVLTTNKKFAEKIRHLSDNARIPHPFGSKYKEIGFNLRMPGINAALGLSQLNRFSQMMEQRKKLSEKYVTFFKGTGYSLLMPPVGTISNHWMNALVLNNLNERNEFIKHCHRKKIMVSPIWRILPGMPVYKSAQTGDLSNSKWLWERVVFLPSSV